MCFLTVSLDYSCDERFPLVSVPLSSGNTGRLQQVCNVENTFNPIVRRVLEKKQARYILFKYTYCRKLIQNKILSRIIITILYDMFDSAVPI